MKGNDAKFKRIFSQKTKRQRRRRSEKNPKKIFLTDLTFLQGQILSEKKQKLRLEH
jgi:hypothetical protein